MTTAVDPLEIARRHLGLTGPELWIRYFAVGGMSSPLEVEAILYGALVPTDHDRDLLAVAINERCAEGKDDLLLDRSLVHEPVASSDSMITSSPDRSTGWQRMFARVTGEPG